MKTYYPLIVIGAGITGLSTALAWKKVYPGKDILVLEKNAVVGGCVTTFARQGYLFDTTQIIPDVSDLLDYFNITIPLKRFEGYYARLFMANPAEGKAKVFCIPDTHHDFEKVLINTYPQDARTIQKFFSYCRAMHAELPYLKTEPCWYQIPKILFQCKRILVNSNKTYHSFLKRFRFNNPEVFRILDTFSSFSGLSGDRCAALLTACAMVTTLNGSFRPEKGFIQFPLALLKKAQSLGVNVRTKATVKRILVESGNVVGIELSDKKRLAADYVVCTADTKYTFESLLDWQTISSLNKRYARKVHEIEMSCSGFSIHLGLDDQIDLAALGLRCGYNVLTSGQDAFESMFKAWDRKKWIQSNDNFHLAVICPSLMTGGKPTIIIHVVPVHSDYWIQLRENDYDRYLAEKEQFAWFYIQKTEQYMINDLSNHIVFMDVSTPATYKRYIGSPTGSQYDMMPVPGNFGKNRLPTRTPVRGLFVPKFSHGIWPCMQAGLQVVDMISGGSIMNGNSSYDARKGR